jgi:hypothetical protein
LCWLLLAVRLLLLQLTETGDFVHQKAQNLYLVCCVMRVDHLLPNLLAQRQELPTKLIEARVRAHVVFLRCRYGRCWYRRVHGVRGRSHPLRHFPDLVGSALSKA